MANTTIIKGSDYQLSVALTEKTTKKPVYVDTFTSAKVYVRKEDDTIMNVSGTQHPDDKSRILFAFTDTDTGNMKAGEGQDFDVELVSGTNTTRKQFIGVLDVFEPLS